MTKFKMSKIDKNYPTIISNKSQKGLPLETKNTQNPYAYLHTMKKTHAKFQNDRYKTVRRVAFTRRTHCLYIEGEK